MIFYGIKNSTKTKWQILVIIIVLITVCCFSGRFNKIDHGRQIWYNCGFKKLRKNLILSMAVVSLYNIQIEHSNGMIHCC